MEFDELLITTGVDALVRLVKEKERVELEDASAILNIPVESLEDWARVLEEEGILRIEYRLTHIYLIWVRPTAEEIEQEKESFYEAKEDIQSEVKRVRERITKETEGLADLQTSFTQFYEKSSKRIEELEKSISPIPGAKSITGGMYAEQQKELQEMGRELAETRSGLEAIREELEGLGIGKEPSQSQEVITRMEAMASEMHQMLQEMERLRKITKEGTPEDVKLPSMGDMKAKFEAIRKEFSSLKSRNAKLREDMLSLQESSEILHSVAESIMGQEEKIGGLRKEVEEVASEAEALAKKVNEMDRKAKLNLEVVERLGDSIEISKNVLKKFPSQQKVLSELDALKLEEQKVEGDIDSLGKVLEAAGGRQISAKKFQEVSKRMDERSKQVRRDLDALESTLEHEKSTYLTYQKIRERIVPSMEAYSKKMEALNARIAQIRDDAVNEREALQKGAKELEKQFKGGQMEGVMKVAEEIRDKKKMLEDIRESLDGIISISDNLNKRVTLLSREAKLLQIRAGAPEGAKAAAEAATAPEKEEELRHQLDLSREEEMEFRRKREELKKLIKTLWETE